MQHFDWIRQDLRKRGNASNTSVISSQAIATDYPQNWGFTILNSCYSALILILSRYCIFVVSLYKLTACFCSCLSWFNTAQYVNVVAFWSAVCFLLLQLTCTRWSVQRPFNVWKPSLYCAVSLWGEAFSLFLSFFLWKLVSGLVTRVACEVVFISVGAFSPVFCVSSFGSPVRAVLSKVFSKVSGSCLE